MRKIGIFGGTFNPVHNEHKEVAISAISELGLDLLLVMPNYVSPHKTDSPASTEDRLNMLRLAFDGVEKVEICDYEIKKGGTSYSYQTVTHLKEVYGDDQLFFIMGADSIKGFKTWRYPEIILSKVTLCVFDRENSNVDMDEEREYLKRKYDGDFINLNYIGKNCSSTKIRVYSAFGLDITPWVDRGVAEYIENKNLYGGNPYIDYVKKVLPIKRLTHTANVVVCALKKYKELGLDKEKVITSTVLHDNAKYLEIDTLEGFTLPDGVPDKVVHAFSGAFVAQRILGVDDEEIIDAIRYHTSGRANMSLLGKLVFVADMLEEGRNYEGVEKLRALYDGDFEHCFRECLKEETVHLLNAKLNIFVETLNAYDYYIKNKKE